ncbi:MAG: Rho termination factor N-terminal domain-containing protein [Actinomycetota bacterium]|nr:Rho termination factor N-terminal domain-containing protein [Actinomycetota bacterium]
MATESDKNLDEMTVAELRERASELEITGRSSMNKADLLQAVEDAEEQTAHMSSSGTSTASSDSSSQTDSSGDNVDSGSDTKDRPWRKGNSSSESEDGENAAAGITAPSIGPNTKIDLRPPEERIDPENISNVDAMGLDKRRQVGGQRYGASPAKQAAVYGGALAVIIALVIGAKLLTDELDKAPPEGEVPDAPWAAAEQKQPPRIDFPRSNDQ